MSQVVLCCLTGVCAAQKDEDLRRSMSNDLKVALVNASMAFLRTNCADKRG